MEAWAAERFMGETPDETVRKTTFALGGLSTLDSFLNMEAGDLC